MDVLKEFNIFMQDIENTISNQSDLEYIKEQAEVFKNTIATNKKSLEEKVDRMERRLLSLEGAVANIETDLLYENEDEDDGYEFEIICPFCDNEFFADISDENEIKCPECQNVIKLDWSQEEQSCCGSGGCPGCHKLSNDEEDM